MVSTTIWSSAEVLYSAAADQGIKVTFELLKINNQECATACNLTFDPWKSSIQEHQKGIIKRSSTLLADKKLDHS